MLTTADAHRLGEGLAGEQAGGAQHQPQDRGDQIGRRESKLKSFDGTRTHLQTDRLRTTCSNRAATREPIDLFY